MAVLGASRAFKDWQVANGVAEASEDGEAKAATESIKTDGDMQDLTDEELKILEDEDPLSLIDSLNTRVGTPLVSGISNSTYPLHLQVRSVETS